MNSFRVVVHVRVPIVCNREQLFERLSGAAFSRCQDPVGADDDSSASNSFEMDEPFMRAELGSRALDDSELFSISDREIISEKKKSVKHFHDDFETVLSQNHFDVASLKLQ